MTLMIFIFASLIYALASAFCPDIWADKREDYNGVFEKQAIQIR
jgi:hypothetical protein